MIARVKGLVLAALAPLVLVGCVLAPGKFVSTLTVDADRSFTFTYRGEMFAIDFGDEFASGMDKAFDGGETADDTDEEAEPDPAKQAEKDRQYRAMAEALRKEAGYRSVSYEGDGRFLVDYAISGTLTHNFVFPYNHDAEAVFPFMAIELRGKDTVRVKAPGYSASDSSGSPGSSKVSSRLDGTFTLTTDAAIVSQNSETGATSGNGRSTLRWRATPLTKDAPMAVLRVAPLP